jgi:hypothetical protein
VISICTAIGVGKEETLHTKDGTSSTVSATDEWSVIAEMTQEVTVEEGDLLDINLQFNAYISASGWGFFAIFIDDERMTDSCDASVDGSSSSSSKKHLFMTRWLHQVIESGTVTVTGQWYVNDAGTTFRIDGNDRHLQVLHRH